MRNKLRIGIETFFQSNYGAILQAYALRRYLTDRFDADVEIINFTTNAHLKNARIIRFPHSKNLIRACARLSLLFFRYPALHTQRRRIAQFKEEYLHLTKRYFSVEDMLNNMPDKDIYVTGSDQVFNPNSPYSPVYYLAFDKKDKKKVAYAPSFGISKFSDSLTAQIRDWLLDFDALSCREKTGADYMSSIVNTQVPTVVDPVLLLKKEQWQNVMITPKTSNSYIFVYDRNGGNNLISLAQKISTKVGLPIWVISSDNACHYKVDRIVLNAGPREFVGYIANAEYVITDSFHGTMFSLIFGKQFYVYQALPGLFSRIENVLNQLGLQDRIIKKDEIHKFSMLNHSNDIVIKEDFLINSKEYLDNAIII